MGRASLSRRAPGLLALCVGMGAAGGSGAASPPGAGEVPAAAGSGAASLPAIVWDAPPGCPDGAALTAEISRHLDPTSAPAPTGSIRVQARPSGERWHVVVAIEAEGRTQERTLAVASCDAAVRAAAFVIAIAVDPAQREPQDVVPAPPAPAASAPGPDEAGPAAPRPAVAPVGPPTPEEAGPEPIAEDPAIPAAGAPRKPKRRAVRGLVQFGPGVQAGMLPVSAGLAAAVGLMWRRARLTAGYTRWFEAEVRRGGEPAFGAQFAVHAGQLRGGPVLRAGPLELPLQVGLELGALQARGVGGDTNYEATTLWGAVTAGAGLAWAPRALRGFAALVVLAEAAISLRRPRFEFAGGRELHQVGPAAFRGFLLVEARFP
ncbi:hypothetical protein [Nannocystis bainbridge]|uniref:Uncharacterized protein n=1 Tax=Nannocystis bainbridge TaxID=2995303 RepID=A0ABT5DSU5_9BACT|nr:hypothetical protein [Nannocystis bainbridge]MDC0716711.1 hypothetical protein [Nannocystis bainbridge]